MGFGRLLGNSTHTTLNNDSKITNTYDFIVHLYLNVCDVLKKYRLKLIAVYLLFTRYANKNETNSSYI